MRETIKRTAWQANETNGHRWYIQTYHSPSGIPWAEEECPHYPTRATARAALRELASDTDPAQ